jgi:protease I
MERVLVLAGDAVEDLELFYVLYRLREAGYEVDIAALSRRTMRTVVHDFEPDSDAYVEKPGRRVEPDLAFSEVEPERYAGLVIPGGRAPEYIRVDPDVRRIVGHFFDHDLPVGTLCHGPQVPAALGYLQGRKSSGFPPLGPDIEAAGGTYVEGADVVDGNMVSCRGWGDLAEWSKARSSRARARRGSRPVAAQRAPSSSRRAMPVDKVLHNRSTPVSRLRRNVTRIAWAG